MSAVMSDRAAVNKSFARALDAERRRLLQTNDELLFLYCNAHYLLGLSTACEKTLKSLEYQQPLGRDKLPGFQSFKNSSESSAQRYIRLACDCLGPRGDDKNSCQDLWAAYCLMTAAKSIITSFRGNRFNNFFEAAAALHFHREDVRNFLEYMPNLNRKLQSVQADNNDNSIDCQMIALTLGLLFYRFTGPFWELLGRNVHYLDFHLHVMKLHGFLQLWSANPADASANDFEYIFGVQFMPNLPVFQALLNCSQETKKEVKCIIRTLCQACLETTERQLADFLPGEKYHEVEDEELRQRLQHSKLTNLLSEEMFGDLDFSLFKRRSASVHHHSTINMLKRNKSISALFSMKTPEQQEKMLRLSAEKAGSLRKRHRIEEKEAVVKRQFFFPGGAGQKN